jgi:hypothetical protein
MGRVRRLCQHPKIDATKPIFSPNDPRVLFINEAAIVFCSNIPCITFLISSHLFNVIRPIYKNESGESFCRHGKIRTMRAVYNTFTRVTAKLRIMKF